MHVKLLQSCLTLREPMDWSLSDSPVHEILQARTLEQVAMPSSRESSPLREQIHVSFVSGDWQVGSLPLAPPGKSLFLCMCLVAQSFPTLCDCMDCSLLASSVHGILQARILEQVAISSSRRSSQPRDQIRVTSPALVGGFFTTTTTERTCLPMQEA